MLWYSKPLIRPNQISKLLQRKYASDGTTILDPIFQIWWNKAVTLFPMWMAPNLITFLGLLINVVPTLAFVVHCPTASESLHPGYPIAVGIGLFLYQTFDAVDGKQARRTNSSNALGELFDHGCDALTTLLLGLAIVCALGTGNDFPYLTAYVVFTAISMFYVAHWQAYVTGRMMFNSFDVTEAQVIVMIIMAVTSWIGVEGWSFTLLGVLPLRQVPIGIAFLMMTLGQPAIINRILFGGAGRNGSTVAGTSVLSPIIPLFLFIISAFYIATNSPSMVYEKNPVVFIFTFGLVATKLTNKLIVAQMTMSEFDIMDVSMCGPLALFVNQWKGPFIEELTLLYVVMAFSALELGLYCSKVCWDICEGTGWYLFKINVNNSSVSSSSGVVNKSLPPQSSSSQSRGGSSPRNRNGKGFASSSSTTQKRK